MPLPYRVLEVALYSVLNLHPFLLFALYPFRRQLRFSKPVTLLLIALLTVIQIGLGLAAAFLPLVSKGLLSFISTVVYALFYFTAVNAAFGKTLFTLLMLSNVSNVVCVVAKCAEGLIFGRDMALQSYRWTYSVCMIWVTLAVAVPLLLYFRRTYSDGITKQAGASSWNYLWLIPTTFYLLWFWQIYGSEKSSLEIALEPSSVLFLLCINLGAFLVYHTIIVLVNEQERNRALTAQTHQLEIQNLQYENLNRQITATRQARHDLRHHIAILDEYLTRGEYDRLHAYLQDYKQTLPGNNTLFFCKHNAVNVLLTYFAQQAEEKRIDFSVFASLPERIAIPDSVISALLGNLLENALEACQTVRGRPAQICVKTKMQPDALFIQIENTYGREPVQDANGRYLSSKRKGLGIGLESVRNIAAQYDGLLEIEPKDGRFRVSVLLNIADG